MELKYTHDFDFNVIKQENHHAEGQFYDSYGSIRALINNNWNKK